MTTRKWLLLVFLLLAPELWLAIASAIYCGIIGEMELWTFPFWQWLEAFHRRREMYYWPHLQLREIITHPMWGLAWGAIAPTLAVLLVLATLFATRRRNAGPSVYGDSKRATIPEMLAAGFRLHRKPFW